MKKLLKLFRDQVKEAKAQGVTLAVPTTSFRTLEGWSRTFDWVRRAELYDAAREIERSAMSAEILSRGVSQAHERVAIIQEITDQVLSALQQKGVYDRRERTVIDEDGPRVVTDKVFRSKEIQALRGLLDDAASEVGGRTKNVNLTGAGGLAGLFSTVQGWGGDLVEDADYEMIDDENDQDQEEERFEDEQE